MSSYFWYESQDSIGSFHFGHLLVKLLWKMTCCRCNHTGCCQKRTTMSELPSTMTGELCYYRSDSAVTFGLGWHVWFMQPPSSTLSRVPGTTSSLLPTTNTPTTSQESSSPFQSSSPVIDIPESPPHLSPYDNGHGLPQYGRPCVVYLGWVWLNTFHRHSQCCSCWNRALEAGG